MTIMTVKLYNGKDGDTFFGDVRVGSTSVEFILADGTGFKFRWD